MSTTPIYISGFCSPSPRVHDPLAGRLRRRARALESDQDGLRRRHPRGTQPLAARAAAARDRLVRLAGRRMAGDPRVLVPRPLAQHGAARPAPWLGRRRRHLGPSAHAARDRLDLAPLGVGGWGRLAGAVYHVAWCLVLQRADWSAVKRRSWGRRTKGLLGSPVVSSFYFVLLAPFCPWWGWPLLAIGLYLTCSWTAFLALGVALIWVHPDSWLLGALGTAGGILAVVLTRLTGWRVLERTTAR